MLTIEKVREYARKNYNRGGDVVFECWEDDDIQKFIDEGNTLKDLDYYFSVFDEHCKAAEFFSGEVHEDLEYEDEDGTDDDIDDNFDDDEEFISYWKRRNSTHDTPSASNGDYGPSNPWDAPGMSIRDFI